MPDEVTLGEIVRRLDTVRSDCKEDARELRQLVDTKVSIERYQLEQLSRDDVARQLADRVRVNEEIRDQEQHQRRAEEIRAADRRAADRRLIFTAIVAPVVMLFLQLYLSARGAGR